MKQLEQILFRKKRWFVDCRLGEIRNVDNPFESIKFDDLSESMINKLIKIVGISEWTKQF